MREHTNRFMEDISGARNKAELYQIILGYCVMINGKYKDLISSRAEDLESNFKSSYYVYSGEVENKTVAMALSRLDSKVMFFCDMPKDIESIKRLVLDVDPEVVLLLASSLLEDDKGDSFCKAYVVLKMGQLIEEMARKQSRRSA